MNKTRQSQAEIKREIRASIELGNSKGYKSAIAKIKELKVMSEFFRIEEDFEVFIHQIASDYSRKSSFIRMLKGKKLINQ